MIITIDGPSGSGKSTLAVSLARELSFFCLNSGYLYRGLAYVLTHFYGYNQAKLQTPDNGDIVAIFVSGQLRYEYEYGLSKIYWADVNITQFLKDPEISKIAAILGAHEIVRSQVRTFEQNLINGKDCVAEGRSIGTTLFPHAEVKFYLDAAQLVRASRLMQDQLKWGYTMTLDQAFEHIKMRDTKDATRSVEPLIKPQDAIVLDSSQASSQEILSQALHHVAQALKKQ